jgi:sugar transferase (PEP-CTERM system associated)
MQHVKLFNHYIQLPFLVLGVLEFAVLVAAVFAGSYLGLGPGILEAPYVGDLTERAVLFAFVMTCSTLAMGVYLSKAREGFTGMAVRTLASFCLLGGGGLTALFYLFPSFYLGQSVLAISITLSVFAVLVIRYIFFMVVDTQYLQRRTLLFGVGNHAVNFLTQFEGELAHLGVDIVGCVPAGEAEAKVPKSRMLKPNDDESWVDFVRRHRVSEIVICVDERRRGQGAIFPVNELVDCKMIGVRVTEVINFCEREVAKIELEHLNPGWLLFSDGFKYSQLRDAGKRVFDLACCLLLLAIVWPMMLLTMLAVAIETGRPVIYRQTRVGRNGKQFTLFKFRSMRLDAEGDGKAVWASKDDDRITLVGKIIRNTRLDELPQLFNVLRGDMSFVGPRPERPEFVGELTEQIPFYDARARVKPGLMGWAQLKYPYGASVKDAEEKLRYDLYYVKNHSFLLDVLIVVQTVEVILLGKGVH